MLQPFPPPADWFALIIQGLVQCLGRCSGPNPRAFSGLPNPSLPDQLLTLIWERLQRLRNRFAKRLARHAAGLIPPLPPAVPGNVPEIAIARSEAPASSSSRPKTGAELLPRNDAWLLRLIQETAIYRSQFQHFLADPEITALLAADPQLCRILRPLCHALGIRRDQALSLWPAPPPDAPPPEAPPQAAQAPPPPWPMPGTPTSKPPAILSRIPVFLHSIA